MGLGVLNEMISKLRYLQLHRMETEGSSFRLVLFQQGPGIAGGLLGFPRRWPGALQSSPIVPGAAETGACGIQYGPLPSLTSLENELL